MTTNFFQDRGIWGFQTKDNGEFTKLMHVYSKEIWIYVFPEKELRGLSPSFHIHVSVSDLRIYSHVRPTYFPAAEETDRSEEYIYKPLTETWM